MALPFFRKSAAKKRQPIRSRDAKPLVEYLERREVPATFIVTNTGDNGGVDPLAGAGTGTLRQAIVDANADTSAGVVDVIKFRAGLAGATINLAAALPTISDDVKINGTPTGAKVRVDGGDLFRIFQLNDGGAGTISVTISRLQLQDGFSGIGSNGAAILNSGAENLTILSSTLTGNTAVVGGAVSSGGGAVQVKKCQFTGNTATTEDGGAIAVYNGTLLIQSCSFTGNTAGDDGGALYSLNASAIVIRNSKFTGANTAAGSGGAINLYQPFGSVLIESCTISGNIATAGDGGGVYLSNFNYYGDVLTIHKSTVSGNSAGDDGGGVFVANNATVLVRDSKVNDNTAANDGGGLFLSGDQGDTLTIRGSTISGNEATAGSGGGAYLSGDRVILTVLDSTVSDNTAGADGGGLCTRTADTLLGGPVISNSRITNNEAGGQAGGVLIQANFFYGPVIIEKTTITGNTSVDEGGGLILHAAAGTYGGSYGGFIVRDTTIASNTSTTGDGGGLWFSQDDPDYSWPLRVENTTISGNSAVNGGGVYFNAPGASLVLHNSTVSGNDASSNGGGVYIQSSDEVNRLENSTIAFNSAGGQGGGLFVNSGIVDLLSTIVGSNNATSGDDDLAGNGTVNAVFSLIEEDSAIGGITFNDNGFNQLGVVPRLKPLANNGGPTLTHALKDSSPAINRGFNFSGSPFDQRGKPRTKGAGTDIGAVEQK